MLIRRNLESSHYETSESGNYDHEYYIDDSGEYEDEVDSNAEEFKRGIIANYIAFYFIIIFNISIFLFIGLHSW